MTQKRDPDIMAMDHAVTALSKSTPRMLEANLDVVTFIVQKRLEYYRRKGMIDVRRPR